MRTRLSVFCDKVIEAGWLVAVIVVPLFFNIYSQRVFEPDKISLLRSLVVVMSAAWLLRVVEDWRAGARDGLPRPPLWERIVRTPLVLPTLLLVAVYLLTSITSVDWKVSLLGSYQRLQGTYTTLSYIVIFFLLLDGMRTRRQLNQLVTTAILVSFPIAMYGLVQHFGLDPLPWGGNVITRVASNMGNAIFVAAFLIMVLPLTLSRLLENWQEAVGEYDRRDALLAAAGFGLLAAALLAGVLLGRGEGTSWARWPALAAGAGLQVPIYALSPVKRRPRVLALSLPLTFIFLVGFSWSLEIFVQPDKGTDVSRYFWLGVLAALAFVIAMAAFATYLRRPVARLLLLAGYGVILVAQVACIIYTGSRGPLLGLLGGLFAYLVLLGLVRRRVWLPWLASGLLAATAVFLILFNTANWPVFERLRDLPYIGRLGQVLQTEEGTGKVRVLIWDGVVDMVTPHTPVEVPGDPAQPDRLNALRPLLGYGPESMYVVYNRFYPAELAHYEKRNASPDRSHNETFDALATTGILGLLVYLFVFASVFYFGLKWLGLIRERWHRLAFVGLWVAGGVVGTVASWAWGGLKFIGVGVPVGVMLGMAVFLLVDLLEATRRREPLSSATNRAGDMPLLLVALFAALVAHFVEIHFGIAIAATRTYFWVYAALLVVIGTRLAAPDAPTLTPAPVREVAPPAARPAGRPAERKQPPPTRRGAATQPKQGQPRRGAAPAPGRVLPDDWWGTVLAWSILALLVVCILIFDWTTVQAGDPGALATLWQSLTRRAGEPSPVLLVVLLLIWGTVALVAFADLATQGESERKQSRDWLRAIGLLLGTSLIGAFVFGLIHAARLRAVVLDSPDAANPLSSTIVVLILFLGLVVLTLAAVLSFAFRRITVPWRSRQQSGDLALVAAALTVPLALALVVYSNLYPIIADILYKQGLSSEKASEWPSAVLFYDQALRYAPDQDFYYLFMGRALMELGRSGDTDQQSQWFEQSELALVRARDIAPLNTDHWANLGRLYRTWGGLSAEPERAQKLNRALDYYGVATRLSPQNVGLLNEWGQAYMALGNREQALAKLEQSLALDPAFAQTHAYQGDLYLDGRQWAEAVRAFSRAIELDPKAADSYASLGYAYSQLDRLDDALIAYQTAARLRPRSYVNRKNLALMYQELGRIDEAIVEATQALDLAPESEKASIQTFLAQLRGQAAGLSPEDIQEISDLIDAGRTAMDAEDWAAAEAAFLQVVAIDRANTQAHGGLAFVYARQGKVDLAITENLAVLDQLPDDWGTYQNLALLYDQKGEIDKAIAAAQRAVALAPDDQASAIQAFLDELTRRAGQPTPAATPSQKAGDLEPAERNNMYTSPPPMLIDPAKTYQATIVTAKGDIVIELYASLVPNTVNNFVFLAQQGFYDNTTFHRVISGFMAQAGDPTGTGRGGPGYRFADEFAPSLRHDKAGTLSMANAGANTNGSQFFITYDATPWLDGKHAVFGRVTAGMEVLKAISPRDPQKNPATPGDAILTIRIDVK